MRRFKKGQLTQKILAYLGDTAKNLFELGVTIIIDPHSLTKGFSLYGDPGLSKPVYERMVRQRMDFLRRKGYLEKSEKTKCGWQLTPKGRIEVIKIILYKKPQQKKWDGKWRIIMFDIPELSRKDRDFLRRELKWIGFKEVQKSVWVFPYNMEREMMALLRLWKLKFQGDIRFLVVDRISDEEDLKKYFKIEEDEIKKKI